MKARLPLWLLLGLWALQSLACAPSAGPEALLQDYLKRLNNVLERTAQPQKALVRASYPRPRERLAETGEIRIGLLDFFELDRCGLESLVGQRNSGLGKVMPPSRRLDYELKFLHLATACRDSGAAPQAPWEKILAAKERDLPLVWWNTTFGSEEFAGLFTGSTEPLPLAAAEDPATAAVEALLYLNSLQNTLGTASLNVTQFEKHLLHLQTQAYGDRLLRSIALLASHLEAAAAALEERQAQRPVCLNGSPTPRGRTLQTVFRKFYVGGIQPYLAQVHRRGDQFFEAFERLYQNQQAPVPQAYAAYYDTYLDRSTPQGPWFRFEAAVQRHTTAWQGVLDHCGMAPGL